MPEGIEDNYVDELFLAGMPHKNSFPDLHYPKMIRNTVEVVHIINSVFFQIALFYILMHSQKGSKIENFFLVLTMFLSFGGYVMYRYYYQKNEVESKTSLAQQSCLLLKKVFGIIFSTETFTDFKTIFFLTMILGMLTPVLGNLTATVSDNSIILFYSFFVFIHLI